MIQLENVAVYESIGGKKKKKKPQTHVILKPCLQFCQISPQFYPLLPSALSSCLPIPLSSLTSLASLTCTHLFGSGSPLILDVSHIID
jgi:hypothetical protein